MIWYDMIRQGICDMIWYDKIWYDMIRYDMIRYDTIWIYDMIGIYDTIGKDDMIWIYHLIQWYDMIWYDMIYWWNPFGMTQTLHRSMTMKVIVLQGRCDFDSRESKTFSMKSCRTCPNKLKSTNCVNSPTNTQIKHKNCTYSLEGKTLLDTHKRQEAFPDTLPTNSFMTRVFPVPQAISIFLAPFAQASKQSCWHFLNGGSEGVASWWMPVLEVAQFASSLPERQLVAVTWVQWGGWRVRNFVKRSWNFTNLIGQKMSKVESSTAADPYSLTNPRLFIIVRVTPLNWAYDLCSQDLDLLSTSRKLLVTRVQFAAWPTMANTPK